MKSVIFTMSLLALGMSGHYANASNGVAAECSGYRSGIHYFISIANTEVRMGEITSANYTVRTTTGLSRTGTVELKGALTIQPLDILVSKNVSVAISQNQEKDGTYRGRLFTNGEYINTDIENASTGIRVSCEKRKSIQLAKHVHPRLSRV